MAILFKDLADYDEIIGSLKNISNASKECGDSLVSANDRAKQSIIELRKEAENYRASVEGIGKLTDSTKNGVVGLSTAVSNQTAILKQNQTVVESNNKVIQSVTDRLEALEKEYNSLGDVEKKDIQRKRDIQRELVSTAKALNGLASATQGTSKAVKAAEGSYNALKESTEGLLKQLREMPDAYVKGTGKINEQNKAAVELNKQYQQQVTLLGKIDKGQQVGRSSGGGSGLGGQIGGAIADVSGLGALGSAAGIAGVIASAGAAVISVGQEYGKLNLLTENALNNNKKAAQEANALIVDFANHSPLSIGEVTEAFTRLVSIGIIPSEEELKQISDIAIAKNKTINDYVELIADAQQGQFDRLAEFSINAQKSGDKVVFTYKGVSTAVDNSSTAIANYLIGLGKLPGIMGATDKLAESFSGRVSTMWDGLKGIANDIFQLVLPALNALSGGISYVINKISTYTTGLRALYKAGSEKYGGLGGAAAVAGGMFTGIVSDVGEAEQAKQAKAGNAELAKLKKQTDAQNKLNDAKRKQREADEKAAKNADKTLHDNLSNKSAATDSKLATLNDNKQDGLISEREFIKQRQEITLAGIKEREDLLAKAHKTETAEYQKLGTEKKAIATLTKRDLMKLELSDSKTDATNAVAGLGKDKEQGLITETEYNERKRGILLASVTEQRGILQKYGQQNSELAKALNKQALDIDKDYFTEKLKIAQKGWKEELDLTKDELKAIDDQTAESYDNELRRIEEFYNKKQSAVRRNVINGKISSDEGDKQSGILNVQKIEEQITAVQTAYMKDKFNSDVLTDAKIKNLEKQKAANGRTKTEIEGFDKQIADLKKARDDNQAANDKKRTKEVGDYKMAKSNQVAKNDEDNDAKKEARQKAIADMAIQIGTTAVEGLFAIEQQNTQNKLAELDKQQTYELEAAGNNEAAKSFIQKKFDNERKQLQHKQDVQNREKALFEIAINTAVAISKVVDDPILAILAGVLGAVQAGIVLATPLPQYFTGKNIDGITNDNYAGPALVGDRYGRELWQHDGITELVDKPTMINVGRNDVIYPNHMTERLLEVRSMADSVDRQNFAVRRIEQNKEQYQTRQFARAIDLSSGTINQLVKGIAKANEELPFNQTVFDENGVYEWFVKKDERVKYLNKRRFGSIGR